MVRDVVGLAASWKIGAESDREGEESERVVGGEGRWVIRARSG